MCHPDCRATDRPSDPAGSTRTAILRKRRAEGQGEHETRSPSGLASDGQLTGHRPGHFSADREPQSDARLFGVAGQTDERLEDRLLLARWNSMAAVLDFDD